MAALAQERHGTGPPLLLVHGGLLHGSLAWADQLDLAERWTVIVVDRAGYGASAGLSDREDFELDARLLAEQLEPGTHLVGWSSGALAALLAAARRPDQIASLTLIEPPAFHAAPDSAAARELLRRHEELWADADEDPVAFLCEFFALNDLEAPPEEALAALAGPAVVWRGFRRLPWHGDLPLDELAAAGFPKLVVSGGHSEGFEDVCDAIAAAIGGTRAVIRGQEHAVQRTGADFNRRLEAFLGESG